MKNVLIGVFAGISALSLGYVAYDEFIKEENVIYQECNKEEICDECVCDNENYDDMIEEDTYEFYNTGFSTNNGKEYTLDVYTLTGPNVKIDDFRFNNKPFKLEAKDSIIYLNEKKVGEAQVLYVTNSHMFLTGIGQNGLVFLSAVDQNGNVTYLEENKTIDNFQATHIYLDVNGNLVTVGGKFCGLDCDADTEVVTFKNNNGKLEITKEKLK